MMMNKTSAISHPHGNCVNLSQAGLSMSLHTGHGAFVKDEQTYYMTLTDSQLNSKQLYSFLQSQTINGLISWLPESFSNEPPALSHILSSWDLCKSFKSRTINVSAHRTLASPSAVPQSQHLLEIYFLINESESRSIWSKNVCEMQLLENERYNEMNSDRDSMIVV